MSRSGRSVTRGVLAIVALAIALAAPAGAAAHALLRTSEPASGATLAAAPATLRLTFTERPDPRLTSVRVLATDGTDHAAGPVAPDPSDPLTLVVSVGPLPTGTYTVAWRTVSAVDGHLAAGSFAFGVGVAPAAAGAAPATGASAVDPASVAARAILYLALAVLIGAAIVAAWVSPASADDLRGLVAAGLGGTVVGGLGVVAAQWSQSGASLGAFAASDLGLGALARIGSLAALAVPSIGYLVAPGPARRTLGALTLVTGVLVVAVDVLGGHAAGTVAAGFDVPVQVIHGVAASAWIGGLLALLVAARGEPDAVRAAAVGRYSMLAGWLLATVAATGMVRAIEEVGSPDALVASDVGRVVLLKTALLATLAALGAANRFRSVPQAVRDLGLLRRLGVGEVSLGAVVLVASGLLVNLVPPTSVAAEQGAAAPTTSAIASGADFGTSVKVRLVATPGTPGPNRFAVGVVDYDTGAAVDAPSVSLRFSPASQAGVGDSTLALARDAAGSFSATGSNLSIDGIWRITATVAGPSGPVEVPLVLATAVPGEHVEAVLSPGAPTIDTVHLDSGGSAQLYLDSTSPTNTTLHVTFFDATGSELAVPSATILAVPDTGPPIVASGRELEPGHFVVDLPVTAGSIGVDVVGPDPAGGLVHVSVFMKVGA